MTSHETRENVPADIWKKLPGSGDSHQPYDFTAVPDCEDAKPKQHATIEQTWAIVKELGPIIGEKRSLN
jgi:hypothetical protein